MADLAEPQPLNDTQTAEKLLTLLEALRQEIQPGRTSAAPVSLDSSLDQDLGFDSLARAEMLVRIEQGFGVSLPESLLMNAESPRDLLRELLRAGRPADGQHSASTPEPQLQSTESDPLQAKTLQQVLAWHVAAHGDRPHLYLYRNALQFETISYRDLHNEAMRVATLLLSKGILAGQSVAIMLPTSREYFATFFGILLAGAVPVPIYPPLRPSQLEEHLRRHAGILNNAQARLLVTVPEALTVSRFLKTQVATLQSLISVAEFNELEAVEFNYTSQSQDTAFLQYTSGSTGNPKGVILSHANLLANIRAFGQALRVDSTDVCVSWLPLYHDMGLIGAWLGSLYHAAPLVVFSPLLFLARPLLWLQLIDQHRGTLSAAPNFAYELCLSKLQEPQLQGLDLSCWRAALNGAEAVNPATLRRFSERLRPYGLRPQAMLPVYGLAESSVGLAFPPIEREPLIDRVQREPLMRDSQALAAADDESQALEFVSVGRPLSGHQIRIVDALGNELPERQQGDVEFQGPSTTSGYFRNNEQTRKLFRGDWLDSGDRGYMAGGELFITGRSKDIIIRAGRNLYPHELEQAVSELAGIHKGGVAVFASPQPQGVEQLVIVAETREQDRQERDQLQQQIQQLCLTLLGAMADKVVLAPLHSVPKTSSGKVRRAACRELYQRDQLGRGRTALWWQLGRLALATIGPQIRRSGRTIAEYLYGAYLWMLLAVLGTVVWLLMLPLFNQRWCRSLAKKAMGLVVSMSATRIDLEGVEHLPEHHCVLVANHCSYLDALLLTAVLPPDFGFVAKGEFKRNPVLYLLFRRVGAKLVERFDLQRGLADARRLAQDVAQGQSLIFFPEGTFDRIPGLRPFHMGAFAAAAEAGVAVVPVSIRGSRSKLRAGSWLPRQGSVQIRISQPLIPEGSNWTEVVKLRDQARSQILRSCGEPDRGEE
ncbi:acyl-phosphate glycerol 3-phosphate acyltransferase [Motiliproteus coralliicola]|uniref:Acyl-phosphate glycerol 3-phosphate acyltransferase n=1 Tax=Motiliproteus coralliicola TaxID=2283196 RepID=A0A369WFU0_9GAMM|nr:AMP-binding protein [Motiliproteus coralliicola]RDE19534.1 acyl-phosphate glycerol 3-phosphate acyltransferase [Motiliproteus coralliicola]